jgi:hypothetical protein
MQQELKFIFTKGDHRMPMMGRYCKAYLIKDLAQYPRWNPDFASLKQKEDGLENRTTLADDDCLFLQESLVVTDGIFVDQNIIFRDETPAWRAYCEQVLKFAVPEDIPMSDEPVGTIFQI